MKNNKRFYIIFALHIIKFILLRILLYIHHLLCYVLMQFCPFLSEAVIIHYYYHHEYSQCSQCNNMSSVRKARLTSLHLTKEEEAIK